jgi:hypothetical protein
MFIEKTLESKRAANNQKAPEPKTSENKTASIPSLGQSLADFVKKSESKQAKFVEVENDEEELGYKNVVKLDNKGFKDEFRKVLYFYRS